MLQLSIATSGSVVGMRRNSPAWERQEVPRGSETKYDADQTTVPNAKFRQET
jgi:hypothetical protein